MSSRIEVELTSERPDGTWTWRAAGARQPKGVLDGTLLPRQAKVGDVVRAEADFDLDGITVTAVLPPRSERQEPQRLEVLGPPAPDRHGAPRPTDSGQTKARGPERPRRRRPPEGDGRAAGHDGERRPRPEDKRPPRRDVGRRAPAPAAPPRAKPKKLRPGRAHRDAVLAELPPAQQPIAVQVLRGGIPAVRAALAEQNTRARREGLPEAPSEAVLAIAERLLPRLRVAEWLDRAEAAIADPEHLALRDLRSVVVSADDVAREPSTRDLATRLREILDRRTAAEHQAWLDDITLSLHGGRVVRGLRLSARPPQPGDQLPAEVATRLAEAAGAAMAPDAGAERWATLLDAVAYSAVRRDVDPVGIPPEPDEDLLALVRKHAVRVPGIARLFGVGAPTERSGHRHRRAPDSQPSKHRPSPRRAPPAAGTPGPSSRRPIPPPPGSDEPAAERPGRGQPVAVPAPARTPPADPPAGAPIAPPTGDVAATEPPSASPAPTPAAPAAGAPAAKPPPGERPPAGDALLDPVAGDATPPGPAPEPAEEPVGSSRPEPSGGVD